MNVQIRDTAYMEMCYALAAKARGRTSPNPCVGAVVVNRGEIVGWGYHEKAGSAHAEVLALQRAGDRSEGATAYITLEPCTTWGRTPPCIDRILHSGLARVVVSDYDLNPQVYRKGVRSMRKAGISVTVGVSKEKNRLLNEFYIKYITRKTPFVTLKAAVSLDGKIATADFLSQWISSPETREYTHLVRGEYDALLVGVNTVLRDDPRLTLRHPHWKGKKQVRIILDTGLRLPLQARLLDTLSSGDILLFTGPDMDPARSRVLENRGLTIVPVRVSGGRLILSDVLDWLGSHEISSLLVEGGALVHTSFLEQGLADKLLLTVSPKLIGGAQAPSFYEGQGIRILEESPGLKNIRTWRIQDDILIEGYF